MDLLTRKEIKLTHNGKKYIATVRELTGVESDVITRDALTIGENKETKKAQYSSDFVALKRAKLVKAVESFDIDGKKHGIDAVASFLPARVYDWLCTAINALNEPPKDFHTGSGKDTVATPRAEKQ